MGIALFMTLIFLHIAFGLALAFFVLHYASKTEHKAIKNFGFIVGYLLIVLAFLSMVLGAIFVAKRPHFMQHPCYMHERMRHHHEEMMEQGMPMMQQQKKEDKNEKKITYKHELRKSGKGCPVETKKEVEKELKQGKRTGAACHADMEETKKAQK